MLADTNVNRIHRARSLVALALDERLALVDAARRRPAATRARDNALIQLILHTELSLKELASLTWSAVDLDAGTLTTGDGSVVMSDLLTEALEELPVTNSNESLLGGTDERAPTPGELQVVLDAIGADASGRSPLTPGR